jgi:hypothetical protein
MGSSDGHRKSPEVASPEMTNNILLKRFSNPILKIAG